MFSAGETTAQVAMNVFDDNTTEGIENVTAVLTLSEYTLSLGVRLNQNSSTAIIYIENNSESVTATTGMPHCYCWVYRLCMSCVVCMCSAISTKLGGGRGGIVSPSSVSS